MIRNINIKLFWRDSKLIIFPLFVAISQLNVGNVMSMTAKAGSG